MSPVRLSPSRPFPSLSSSHLSAPGTPGPFPSPAATVDVVSGSGTNQDLVHRGCGIGYAPNGWHEPRPRHGQKTLATATTAQNDNSGTWLLSRPAAFARHLCYKAPAGPYRQDQGRLGGVLSMRNTYQKTGLHYERNTWPPSLRTRGGWEPVPPAPVTAPSGPSGKRSHP
ncbi:hypothetical protein CB1_000932058 [Camelus ferus]|nr:hypothetical protein CB1_000932058 [Camelus ferus]